MNVEIISPEKLLYKGEASEVMLPGAGGSFSVMDMHVPVITILEKGTVKVDREVESDLNFDIQNGVAEFRNNLLVVCVNE